MRWTSRMPCFVELFDPLDDVDPVFGARAELLDDVKPSTFGGAPAWGRASQLPPDMVERMPRQVAIGEHTAVEDGAVKMGEPIEQHRRRHCSQRPMVDGDRRLWCGATVYRTVAVSTDLNGNSTGILTATISAIT
jgi:hypothetical protein